MESTISFDLVMFMLLQILLHIKKREVDMITTSRLLHVQLYVLS